MAGPSLRAAAAAGAYRRAASLHAASSMDRGTPAGAARSRVCGGQTITIDERGSDGRYERLDGLARELVDSKVDVLVVMTGPALRSREAADHHGADRHGGEQRWGRNRRCRQPRAAGRQRHRLDAHGARPGRLAPEPAEGRGAGGEANRGALQPGRAGDRRRAPSDRGRPRESWVSSCSRSRRAAAMLSIRPSQAPWQEAPTRSSPLRMSLHCCTGAGLPSSRCSTACRRCTPGASSPKPAA